MIMRINRLIIGLLGVTNIPSFALADSELHCVFDNYSAAVTSGYNVSVAKSWIPELQTHVLKDDKSALHVDFGLEGRVIRENSKKAEFRYLVDQDNGVVLKYVFFRNNNKATAFMAPSGYRDLGPIRGTCEENEISSRDYISYPDATDEQVCDEVALTLGGETTYSVQARDADGNVINQGWIDEAKKRWGEDFTTECRSITAGPQSLSATTNSSSSNLDKLKSTCTELGFKSGTEKHGDCVLKLMDN